MPRCSTLLLAGSAAWRPPARRWPRSGSPAVARPRFTCSLQEPESGSRHLYAGHRLGRTQASPTLLPRYLSPSVSMALRSLDASSVVPLRSSSCPSPDQLLAGLFRPAHYPGSSTDAADGGLTPPPAGRRRRAVLHLLQSIAPSCFTYSMKAPFAFRSHLRSQATVADVCQVHWMGRYSTTVEG